MNIFDVLAYGAGLMGWFEPSNYNVQKFIWMVAELFGYSVNIGVG